MGDHRSDVSKAERRVVADQKFLRQVIPTLVLASCPTSVSTTKFLGSSISTTTALDWPSRDCLAPT